MSWASVLAVVLLAGSVLAGDRRAVAAQRLRRLTMPTAATTRLGSVSSSRADWLLLVFAGLPLLLPSLGVLGWMSSATAGLLWVLRRRETRGRHRSHREEKALVPRAADLLAACLDAGATPLEALETVADVIGSPVARPLRGVANAMRSGVDLAAAWPPMSSDGLGRIARAFARASRSGAALSETLASVADDARRLARADAEAAARRAGVLAVGPLMVCFLPAFVLLGVVPVVLGVAAQVFSSSGG